MNWNFPFSGLNETCGAVTGSSTGTSLGTTYSQLIAATSYEYSAFTLVFSGKNATQQISITIGIGASGSEFTLIADLLAPSTSATTAVTAHIFLPIRIPAGTRIAAKASVATAGDLLLIGHAFATPGAVAAGSFCELAGTAGTGTTVDPGATANTKGSYTQLASSTTYPWRGFFISLNSASSSASAQDYLLDVAVGGSGSEQNIVTNVLVRKGASQTLLNSWIGPFLCDVAAASRISVRAQCTSNSSTIRQVGVNIHGIVG